MKKTVKYWRNKADKLLTPIIKLMFPKCLLCPFSARNNLTEVAHHFVHKSKSTALRYVIDNLVPLCHQCHQMLHHNESLWAGKIVELRGLSWFKGLDKKKNEIIKADWVFYKTNHDELDNMLKNVESMFGK